MQIQYNSKTDLLYLRLESEKQEVINKRVTEDIVLDIGKDERLFALKLWMLQNM